MASRARTLLSTIARHRLDALLTPERRRALGLPGWVGWLLALNPMRLKRIGPRQEGERLRDALTELGPVYIKLGQMLSTRPDILPAEIANELALLQDRVPPIPSEQALDSMRVQLGQPLESAFAEIDPEPLAAASIAQVHAARLTSGDEVVVKVVRPGLEAVIRQDMALVKRIAGFVERRLPKLRRLKLLTVLDDHEQTTLAELDLLAEAANTTQLRANFAESELLYVPRVHQPLCRSGMLVLERIYGVPVSHVEEMKAQGVDLEVLAARGVETFFTQVFEHNFFHADMHPGNVYVDTTDPKAPSYIALDCAIMGRLTERDQEYLARNLLAFFEQNYAEVARLHVETGWVPPDTDVAEFEAVIRQVCEPIFAKPLSEISFGLFLAELFQTAERFQMEVQTELVLLQKTLLYIEGLGRRLYPELDLWETALPFMERWMAERLGPAAQLQRLVSAAPQTIRTVVELPQQLAAIRSYQAEQAARLRTLEAEATSLRQGRQRARYAGAAMLLIAAFLLWPDTQASWTAPLGVLSALAGSAILVRP